MLDLITDAAGDPALAELARLRPSPLPEVLWIELTSRCPFDCVFCSRKLLRGAGQHMDFALYRRLIGELQSPRIIRLNYSGESIHYPQLVEAVALAAQTGADVELVSALAALPWPKLAPLAAAGLRRLTVSLHTLDAERFRDIYRFAELDALTARLEALRALSATQARPLDIDLAFVAMQRNLDELPAVAAYAQRLGLSRLAVHPVIRRDPIDETFPAELDADGRLRPDFLQALQQQLVRAQETCPQLPIEVSTPEVDDCPPLGVEPRYHPGPLPPGASLFDCDQDPWQTVHILADGSVVSCEPRDRVSLGNLASAPLREIWHGARYMQFRQDYLAGRAEACQKCPYKRARLAGTAPRRVLPGREGEAALVTGWYPAAPGEQLVWSSPRALLHLRLRSAERFRLRLQLPDGEQPPNRVALYRGDQLLDSAENRGAAPLAVTLHGRGAASGDTWLRLEVDQAYRPDRRGRGADQRALGVALIDLLPSWW
jgi:radical SAM protein with 4Fe4S-binding SPASM domain